MKKYNNTFATVIFTLYCLLFTINSFSQGVGINTTGAKANTSAVLDVSSTKQGMLISRMTTKQRNAIVSPAESLLIFNSDTHCFEAYYNGGWIAWGCLNNGCPISACLWGTDNISTFAGNGLQGYAGDGDTATKASLFYPAGISFDAYGNVYIAEYANGDRPRIRKVNTCGIISTFAGGNNSGGALGDGGPATAASLFPMGVAVNKSTGNVYIADYGHNRIRMVNTAGIISTIAGNGTQGYVGDGIAASDASVEMYFPYGIAVDGSGNIYFSDNMNQVVRKINTAGTISTIAGSYVFSGTWGGIGGYSGDGGLATSTNCKLHWPSGIAVDVSGNVYIADAANNRIRKVTKSTGIITTIAGNGSMGYSGDGGAATNAELFFPYAVALNSSGNIYIADQQNQRIRMVNSSGIITTIAGNGIGGYSGDGGAATIAQFQMNSYATGIAVDAAGNIYIGDGQNNRVREVCK